MQVIISVGGRFHAFQLARQLQRYNYLKQIFTSYPYFAVKKERIPKEKTVCLPIKEILQRFVGKIPGAKNYPAIHYFAALLYDKQVSRIISDCDIFFGWAGFSLSTMRKLRRNYKAKTILERSSSHIEFQRDILREEEGLTGRRVDLPGQKIIDKELKEYEESDYILVPSTFARETFMSKGFKPEKIIRINFGTDIQTFRPLSKKDKVFRVIFVGICLRKGIQYLLQAVNKLRLKNFEVWLIGNVNDDSSSVIKKYTGSFKYIGGVPHQELCRYYSQGSVFVLPSLEEGFSYAMLEAMACGIPVIATKHTGAEDIISQGKEGFIVPIRDIHALKEKIIYLYENPQICKQMGDNARTRIESSFTWERYGDDIANFLQSIIKIS